MRIYSDGHGGYCKGLYFYYNARLIGCRPRGLFEKVSHRKRRVCSVPPHGQRQNRLKSSRKGHQAKIAARKRRQVETHARDRHPSVLSFTIQGNRSPKHSQDN